LRIVVVSARRTSGIGRHRWRYERFCGYCLWVSMFSKDVRAELSRRREANMKHESDESRKFYEQLGEKSE
jgi:hypothetical protein